MIQVSASLLAAASFSLQQPTGFCEGAARIYVTISVPGDDGQLVLRVEETLKGPAAVWLQMPGRVRTGVGGHRSAAYYDDAGEVIGDCWRNLGARRPDPEVYPVVGQDGLHVSLPEPVAMRLEYVRAMIALLEDPEVDAFSEALSSDSIPARRAAAWILTSDRVRGSPDAWKRVGRAAVTQLPQEPSDISYHHISGMLMIIARALMHHVDTDADWVRHGKALLLDLTEARAVGVRKPACLWLSALERDFQCSRPDDSDETHWYRPPADRLRAIRRKDGFPADGQLTPVRHRWDRD